MPAPKDPIKREGWIIKNRESHLGERNPNYGKRGEGTPMYGKHQSGKTRAQMSVSHTGSHQSETTRKRQSEVKMGEKNPMFGQRDGLNPLYKTHLTDETRKKISASKIGWIPTEDWRRKQSAAKIGDKNCNWNGGSSYDPYPSTFNGTFKQFIRMIYGNICFIPKCKKTPMENGQELSVHHYNYNKNSNKCIPLCEHHHNQTNLNREYWENYFTEKVIEYWDWFGKWD